MIGVVTDESGSNFTWTWGKACWRCRRDSITAQRDVPISKIPKPLPGRRSRLRVENMV